MYAWSHAQPIGSLAAELSTTLHDHSITDALDDVTSDLEPRTIVGIMGGHAVARGDTTYRAAAELGASLSPLRVVRCSPVAVRERWRQRISERI